MRDRMNLPLRARRAAARHNSPFGQATMGVATQQPSRSHPVLAQRDPKVAVPAFVSLGRLGRRAFDAHHPASMIARQTASGLFRGLEDAGAVARENQFVDVADQRRTRFRQEAPPRVFPRAALAEIGIPVSFGVDALGTIFERPFDDDALGDALEATQRVRERTRVVGG